MKADWQSRGHIGIRCHRRWRDEVIARDRVEGVRGRAEIERLIRPNRDDERPRLNGLLRAEHIAIAPSIERDAREEVLVVDPDRRGEAAERIAVPLAERCLDHTNGPGACAERVSRISPHRRERYAGAKDAAGTHPVPIVVRGLQFVPRLVNPPDYASQTSRRCCDRRESRGDGLRRRGGAFYRRLAADLEVIQGTRTRAGSSLLPKPGRADLGRSQ